MLTMVRNDSPTFLSDPPDGWRPRTPTTADLFVISMLKRVQEQGSSTSTSTSTSKKQDDKKYPPPSSTKLTPGRNKLMLPDDFNTAEHEHDKSAQQRLFSTTKNKQQQTQAQETPPQFPLTIATINEEQEAAGKIATMMCTVDREDKHG